MRTIEMAATILLAAAIPAMPALAGGSRILNTSIYTTYNFYDNNSQIAWATCGSTPGGGGCYQSGQLTGFGNVCAVLDAEPESRGMVTRQKLYVFDSGAEDGSNLILNEYDKIDVTTENYDTTTFMLKSKLTLPISAGPNVKCFVASPRGINGDGQGYLYVGTSTSKKVMKIGKADLSQTPIGGFPPSTRLTSIDIDAAGFVSLNFASVKSGAKDFVLFSPSGGYAGGGGGNVVIFNDRVAYTPP